MGKKRYWLDEEFAKALQALIGRDSLLADATADASMGGVISREIITCVLHADINDTVSRVTATRLAIIAERGSKKAWQVVTDPLGTDSFSLTVNGTTIGPFTASTTTAAFQAALNVITSPATPTGTVVHGNFFVYPATTLTVSSGASIATAYEVPWEPLIGNENLTSVGSRRLAKTGEFKRGSTQAAEFIHGYGFAIASSPAVAATTTSSGCPCNCIPSGDIIVNGVETTSVFTMKFNQEAFPQANGTIFFPAGTYSVVYNPTLGYWVVDIGDYLTATYTNGDDATAATTMDGTIRMEWDGYAKPTVKLCVDGTVPVHP